MSSVPFTIANLGSIIVQSFLYGAFVLLFAVCIYILHPSGGPRQNRPEKSPNIILLVTAVILFLLITFGWIIHILYVTRGFVTHRDTGTEEYFTSPATPILVAQVALYVFQTLVADIIMIYRLHAIWDGNLWICIFPTICWLGGVVSGILVVMAFSQRTSTVQSLIVAELSQRKLVIIAYCVTLALNVFCTAYCCVGDITESLSIVLGNLG